MSVFKNVPGVILYYTDTDSIVTNLSPQQMLEILKVNIGPDMGQLKLECVINRAVFLAPKAYFLELENGDSIVKIKGLNQNNLSDIHKDKLNLTGFINLLQKDSSLNLDQEIWAKNREESTVNILQQGYQLKTNQNKRELIYDNNNFAINTKPFIIHQVPSTSSPKKGC